MRFETRPLGTDLVFSTSDPVRMLTQTRWFPSNQMDLDCFLKSMLSLLISLLLENTMCEGAHKRSTDSRTVAHFQCLS